jgi:hypothetical protein
MPATWNTIRQHPLGNAGGGVQAVLLDARFFIAGIARKWVLDLPLSNLLLSATTCMLRLVCDLSVND